MLLSSWYIIAAMAAVSLDSGLTYFSKFLDIGLRLVEEE